MISKVFSGHSFYHACRYMVNKPSAQVMETEGVREHDFRLMAEDFLLQQELRASKGQACFHSVLSFYPGENPGDEKMVEIAKKYLEGIGINNTQYAITKHTDKDHLHLHIIANLVNNDGQVISDSWIGMRGKKKAQQLTQEYNLIPALKKDLSLTHLEALSQSEANRYTICMAIMAGLKHCRSMEQLEDHLRQQGIETMYKYKGQTSEKQGISFKIEADCFKGSKVDRKFSLGNLQKIFTILKMQDEQNVTPLVQKPGMYQGLDIIAKHKHGDSGRTVTKDPAFEEGEKLLLSLLDNTGRIMEELLKPVHENQSVSPELLREARRKHKRKKPG